MDPNSIIAGDALAHVQDAAVAWVSPAAPFIDEAWRTAETVIVPAFSSVVGGVTAVAAFTGPQMFATIVFVCGAFGLLAIGSMFAHRYP